jgi:hypothetical protein
MRRSLRKYLQVKEDTTMKKILTILLAAVLLLTAIPIVSTEANTATRVTNRAYRSGTYTGEWLNDRPHGIGTLVFPSGDRYEGNFVDGQYHGRGVYTWSDGERYEGDYVNGRPHGRGVHTWPDGFRHEGEFVNGNRHGWGVSTWADGRRSEGPWVDDKPHGAFVFTDAAGQRFNEQRRNGELVSSTPINADANNWIYGWDFVNGIYRFRTDGSGFQQIIDRDAGNTLGLIGFVDGWVYYGVNVRSRNDPGDPSSVTTVDHYICRIRPDGTDRQPLAGNTSSANTVTIAGGWLYFQPGEFRVNQQNRSLSGYHIFDQTVRRNVDTPGRVVVNDSQAYRIIGSDATWTYYTSDMGDLNRMRTDDASGKQLVRRNTNWDLRFLHVADGWVYFLKNVSVSADELHRMRTDGTGSVKLADLSIAQGFTTIEVIGVRDGWIYFWAQSRGIHRIRTDGTGYARLHFESTISAPELIGDRIYYRTTVDNPNRIDAFDIASYDYHSMRLDGTGRQLVISIPVAPRAAGQARPNVNAQFQRNPCVLCNDTRSITCFGCNGTGTVRSGVIGIGGGIRDVTCTNCSGSRTRLCPAWH